MVASIAIATWISTIAGCSASYISLTCPSGERHFCQPSFFMFLPTMMDTIILQRISMWIRIILFSETGAGVPQLLKHFDLLSRIGKRGKTDSPNRCFMGNEFHESNAQLNTSPPQTLRFPTVIAAVQVDTSSVVQSCALLKRSKAIRQAAPAKGRHPAESFDG